MRQRRDEAGKRSGSEEKLRRSGKMKPIEKQRTRLKSICFVAFFWITLQDNIVAEGERKRNRPGSAHLLACASGSRAASSGGAVGNAPPLFHWFQRAS